MSLDGRGIYGRVSEKAPEAESQGEKDEERREEEKSDEGRRSRKKKKS